MACIPVTHKYTVILSGFAVTATGVKTFLIVSMIFIYTKTLMNNTSYNYMTL